MNIEVLLEEVHAIVAKLYCSLFIDFTAVQTLFSKTSEPCDALASVPPGFS